MNRPQAVALDIIETIFDLEPLATRIEAIGLPNHALRTFFRQMLLDAFALEVGNSYKPFREVASSSLAVIMAYHGLPPDQSKVGYVMAGFAEDLTPHPDVRPALERLRAASIPIIALTNGSAANTQKLLEKSDLALCVERIISIDEILHWKPNRQVYLHAANSLAVEPARMALIAAHAWDVHGAKQAGLCGAWVRRHDQAYPTAMLLPDVQGESLIDVVEALIALSD